MYERYFMDSTPPAHAPLPRGGADRGDGAVGEPGRPDLRRDRRGFLRADHRRTGPARPGGVLRQAGGRGVDSGGNHHRPSR